MGKPINQKNITFFQDSLLKWYSKNGRNFPWRNKSLSTYRVVIAEILLQRTKAETVAGFYKDFIKEYPNWKSIAASKIEDIENYLKPVGLHKQRSVRLQQLSIEMVERRGRFPRKREDLESIPFIGQYINLFAVFKNGR